MPRRFLLPCALLAFACLALPAAAEPPTSLIRPAHLRSDILYTHSHEFVQVSPMRALTLNAHVEQFAYDPLGLEIAIVGSETAGDQTTHFVKTIDSRTGHEISRLAVTAPKEDSDADFYLLGFSPSGKYVLLKRYSADPKEPQTALAEFVRWDLSADPPATRTIDPELGLPPEQQSEDLEGSADGYPSPDGRRLLFTQSIHTLRSNGKPGADRNAFVLYDMEHDTFKLLTLPPDASTYSRTDATHLKLWQGTDRKQFDVVTGQISPITTPMDYAPPAVSKQYPDLSLDTQSPEQYDGHTAQESEGHLDSYLIWIRRTPFGTLPLAAAAAGLMPKPQVSASARSDDPQAVWSPTGKQVAFIANHDLYVSDLVPASGAMPNEKLAVGLKLSCADEQALAVPDLKQIGLAITQYMQDNDEKYPASEGIRSALDPFLKSMDTSQADVFQLDGHPFVYEKPAASLGDVEVPAETEIGYMDLPCARVVLMADGHVKAFPK